MTYENLFQVDITRGYHKSAHFHPELEILFVIEGEIQITVLEKDWALKKNDVLLINPGVTHNCNSDENSIICSVRYDYGMIASVLGWSDWVFLCNSAAEEKAGMQEIRNILRELVYCDVLYSRKTESYRISLFYKLLDVLAEHCLITEQGDAENDQVDEKLRKILGYIHENYQDSISLSELADSMFVSTSTLSRYFKKQTGVYFADYVNQVRMKYAVNELIYTEKKITHIAMDCGFSNVSALNKAFRETYNCAPTEYRIKLRKQLEADKTEKEKLNREIRSIVYHSAKDKDESQIVTRHKEELKTSEFTKLDKNWNKVINIGSVYDLTRANVQFQTKMLADQLGFSYVRMWSPVSKKLMICDGETMGAYNYDMIDTVFDFLVQNDLHPWIDFSIRPDAAVSDTKDFVWFEQNNVVFKSKEYWEDFFRKLILHLEARYGRSECNKWYFEYGKDSFHEKDETEASGDDYSFRERYTFFYKTVKEILPGAKVGGIGFVATADTRELVTFIKDSIEDDVKPDYLSYIIFPYERQGKGLMLYKRSPRDDYEEHYLAFLKRIAEENGMGDVPTCVVEWNNTVSSRNFLNDSCFRGTYYCEKIIGMMKYADLVIPWIGSDWVGNYYDTTGIIHGGPGLLTKDSIRKPAFFALSFLNTLGDKMIGIGDGYVVTQRSSSSFQILCYNRAKYSVNYFMKAENQMRSEYEDSIFDENERMEIHIALSGIEDNANFMIKKRSICKYHGSVLDEWENFRYETRLERADVKYLQERCMPILTIGRLSSKDGRLDVDVSLEKHEFCICHVFKVEN